MSKKTETVPTDKIATLNPAIGTIPADRIFTDTLTNVEVVDNITSSVIDHTKLVAGRIHESYIPAESTAITKIETLTVEFDMGHKYLTIYNVPVDQNTTPFQLSLLRLYETFPEGEYVLEGNETITIKVVDKVPDAAPEAPTSTDA